MLIYVTLWYGMVWYHTNDQSKSKKCVRAFESQCQMVFLRLSSGFFPSYVDIRLGAIVTLFYKPQGREVERTSQYFHQLPYD